MPEGAFGQVAALEAENARLRSASGGTVAAPRFAPDPEPVGHEVQDLAESPRIDTPLDQ